MPSSPLVAAARSCLLAVVALVPLVPAEGRLVPVKHGALLGLAALAGALLLADALRGRVAPALGTPTDLSLGLWLLCAVPSALGATAGSPAFSLGPYLALALCYVVALKTLRTPRDVALLYAVVLAAAATVAAFGLVGYRAFDANAAAEFKRASYLSTPFFAHSYLAAQYLAPPFVGGLVLLAERGPKLPLRALLALLLMPVGALLLVIGSRGAWLAMAVGLGTSALLAARAATEGRGRVGPLVRMASRAALWGALGVVLVVLASAIGLLPSGAGRDFVERLLLVFDPEKSEHNFSRLGLWQHTLRMAADHPVTGVGVGAFPLRVPSYHPSPQQLSHAHNQFLQVLAEMGLLGLVAFLYLLRAARHAAVRGAAFLARDPARRGMFHAAVAALTTGCVYFLFETPLQWPEAGSLLVVLLAVLTRAGCLSRDAPTRRPVALAAAAAGAAALLVVVPAQAAFAHAAWLEAEALEEAARGLATGASAAGDAPGETAAPASVPGEAPPVGGAGVPAERGGGETAAEVARRHGERALELLALADARYPYTASLPAQAAWLCHALGDDRRAVELYRVADARMPGTFGINDALGNLLLDVGQPAEAIAPLRAAVFAHRGFGGMGTYGRLGLAYLQVGRYEEAWYVYTDLILLWAYQSLDPAILLDATSVLLALKRAPDFASLLLDDYQRRVPAARAGEDEPYLRLRERVERQASRPKRRFVRAPGM